MLRVLIVAQTPLTCDTVARAINGNKDIKVVRQTTTVDEASTFLVGCDILLISNTIPHSAILALIRQARCTCPHIKTILMGVKKTEPGLLEFIETGVAGYIMEDDSVDILVKKIKAAYNGTPIICPEITALLMVRVAELANLNKNNVNRLTRRHLERLTDREAEILRLLVQDYSNRQISERLFIEIGTVKNHVHNILKKLKVRSRHDAAAYVQTIEVLENQPTPFNNATVKNGPTRKNGLRSLHEYSILSP